LPTPLRPVIVTSRPEESVSRPVTAVSVRGTQWRSSAVSVRPRLEADVHDWEDLAGALAKSDIVIASTGAQRPVLTRELMARVQRARRGRLIFLIDIAMPRDVEPSVRDLRVELDPT